MGATIYIYFFPFSLSVSVYVYASVCDFVCIALLLPLVLGCCLSGFFFNLKIFFLNNYFLFYFTLFYFILSSSFFFFSLLFSAVWRTGSWYPSQVSGLCH